MISSSRGFAQLIFPRSVFDVPFSIPTDLVLPGSFELPLTEGTCTLIFILFSYKRISFQPGWPTFFSFFFFTVKVEVESDAFRFHLLEEEPPL
jgi:hypothetical protein